MYTRVNGLSEKQLKLASPLLELAVSDRGIISFTRHGSNTSSNVDSFFMSVNHTHRVYSSARPFYSATTAAENMVSENIGYAKRQRRKRLYRQNVCVPNELLLIDGISGAFFVAVYLAKLKLTLVIFPRCSRALIQRRTFGEH